MGFNNKGVSLFELLISLIITGIVVLMFAALGAIAQKSYQGVLDKTDNSNDGTFVMQMIRESVRESTSVPFTQSVASGTCLVIPETSSLGTSYYNFYYDNTTTHSFYWGNYCNNSNGHPSNQCCPSGSCTSSTLCSSNMGIISGATDKPLVFNLNISALPLVTVALSGSENNNAFSYSLIATRRNP